MNNKMKGLCFAVVFGLFEFLVNGQSLQSPCPGVFEYLVDRDYVAGMIRIPSDGPVTAITTRANFTVPKKLNSKFRGRLEPIGTQEVLALFNEGAPITYRVYFPIKKPAPRLTALTVNDKLICQGPPDVVGSQQDVTTYSVEHTLYLTSGQGSSPTSSTESSTPTAEYEPPTNENTQVNYDTSNTGNNNDNRRPQFEQRPQVAVSFPTTNITLPTHNTGVTQTASKIPFQPPDQSNHGSHASVDCGKIIDGPAPLIYQGSSFQRGDWPWLVALYRITNIVLRFQCTGTLITDRHVFTAARCVTFGNAPMDAEDILVKLGAYDLQDWGDEMTVVRRVAAVHVHPSYNNATKLDDITILTLEKPVKFNQFISPACLWSGNTELRKIVGASGVVVGWGEDETGRFKLNKPSMIRMPVVSWQTCLSSHPGFNKLVTFSTFCAGDRLGSGPCRGDFGGGLYILDGGRWQLRGIVSQALLFEDLSCNLYEYTVFTDVAQYNRWIQWVLDM